MKTNILSIFFSDINKFIDDLFYIKLANVTAAFTL